jgi:hypothetical protein
MTTPRCKGLGIASAVLLASTLALRGSEPSPGDLLALLRQNEPSPKSVVLVFKLNQLTTAGNVNTTFESDLRIFVNLATKEFRLERLKHPRKGRGVTELQTELMSKQHGMVWHRFIKPEEYASFDWAKVDSLSDAGTVTLGGRQVHRLLDYFPRVLGCVSPMLISKGLTTPPTIDSSAPGLLKVKLEKADLALDARTFVPKSYILYENESRQQIDEECAYGPPIEIADGFTVFQKVVRKYSIPGGGKSNRPDGQMTETWVLDNKQSKELNQDAFTHALNIALPKGASVSDPIKGVSWEVINPSDPLVPPDPPAQKRVLDRIVEKAKESVK